ncbi:hypothetical protein Tco_0954026 [Tanacetum coccineum]|uniref:Uncharacterized protein n=1 Tax=Tanacetum coccineum TaxID=301880 RepID=A0ABQ5E1M6_9ASTR
MDKLIEDVIDGYGRNMMVELRLGEFLALAVYLHPKDLLQHDVGLTRALILVGRPYLENDVYCFDVTNQLENASEGGPYQTNLPSPDDIISYIREDREGQVTRICHQEEVEVQDYQILTREIVSTLKALEEIIRENVFYLGGNRDHVPACLCYMLYYVANSKKFNLAYFMAKRMEWVTKQARLILPYGMLLTCLFDFVIGENLELQNESYVLYDRVMNPLAGQLKRKPRRDRGTIRGRQSTSSSTFDQPSSSHLNDDGDDDDGNDEGTSHASTPSPIRYVNSLTNQVP